MPQTAPARPLPIKGGCRRGRAEASASAPIPASGVADRQVSQSPRRGRRGRQRTPAPVVTSAAHESSRVQARCIGPEPSKWVGTEISSCSSASACSRAEQEGLGGGGSGSGDPSRRDGEGRRGEGRAAAGLSGRRQGKRRRGRRRRCRAVQGVRHDPPRRRRGALLHGMLRYALRPILALPGCFVCLSPGAAAPPPRGLLALSGALFRSSRSGNLNLGTGEHLHHVFDLLLALVARFLLNSAT